MGVIHLGTPLLGHGEREHASLALTDPAERHSSQDCMT